MEAEVLESEFEIENLGQQEMLSCIERCIVKQILKSQRWGDT